MARVLVGEWIPGGRLPWGTLTANVLGSLVIGAVLARTLAEGESTLPSRAFLAMGFCGGFTTFSSFSWQTLEQLRSGQVGVAALHIVISVSVCLGATWLGWRLGRV
ncbi:MAG: fluoride efflux transporter CrcB [Synoicihabitans sp.]